MPAGVPSVNILLAPSAAAGIVGLALRVRNASRGARCLRWAGLFPQGISGCSSFTKGFAMPRKPLIGLNADYRPSRKEGPALSFVAAGYYSAIQAAGGI